MTLRNYADSEPQDLGSFENIPKPEEQCICPRFPQGLTLTKFPAAEEESA
jgi:hypothetical protein